MTLASIIQRLRRCFAKVPNSSVSEDQAPDLSGAADYTPCADLHPDPRSLQRKNQELELRLALVESWIAERDKRFKPWLKQ